MNWVKINRETLEKNNYVLKADTSSNYWFGVSQKKLNDYRSQFNSDFNVILFGSDDNEGDFYVIPYLAIHDLLTEDSIYLIEGRKRWVGDIRNHILRIRNSKVERNISAFFSIPQISSSISVLQKDNQNDYTIENAKREVQVRIKQSIFRRKVLENFNNKCCLTGITENELLVASHIIPWATKIETRLSPHNGLCLCVLYDTLFDKGFFTLSNKHEVVITSKAGELSLQTQNWLKEIVGKPISKPINYEISHVALEHHRNNVFDKF